MKERKGKRRREERRKEEKQANKLLFLYFEVMYSLAFPSVEPQCKEVGITSPSHPTPHTIFFQVENYKDSVSS